VQPGIGPQGAQGGGEIEDADLQGHAGDLCVGQQLRRGGRRCQTGGEEEKKLKRLLSGSHDPETHGKDQSGLTV
jgi:hypothetical protein